MHVIDGIYTTLISIIAVPNRSNRSTGKCIWLTKSMLSSVTFFGLHLSLPTQNIQLMKLLLFAKRQFAHSRKLRRESETSIFSIAVFFLTHLAKSCIAWTSKLIWTSMRLYIYRPLSKPSRTDANLNWSSRCVPVTWLVLFALRCQSHSTTQLF